MIWAQLAREPHPLIVIAGTVTGALCAMALQRYVIILATAFGGAWTALVGALAIAGNRAAQTTDGWVLYPLRPPDGPGVDVARLARPRRRRRRRPADDETAHSGGGKAIV